MGWMPLVVVAITHGAGLWAAAAPRTPPPPSPPAAGMRFALAVAAAPVPAPVPAAQAAPAPPVPPVPVAETLRKSSPAPARKPAAVVAATASASPRAAVAATRSAPPEPSVQPEKTEVAEEARPARPEAAPAAAAWAAEGGVPAAAHQTAPSFTADYQDNPKPDYPRISRRLGEEGVVLLAVAVGADGRAASVAVERSSGHDRLDDAAARGVRGWRFVPARRDGIAVPASVRVPITFSLQEAR